VLPDILSHDPSAHAKPTIGRKDYQSRIVRASRLKQKIRLDSARARRRIPGDFTMKWIFIVTALTVASIQSAHATDLDCISTTFNALSPNDKLCVSVFEDPQVTGVVCHISQARKGGWGQPLGLNEDPSNFSISCRQTGPIDVDLSKIDEKAEVFSQKTSIFFKTTRIYRLLDKPHNTLIYLAISTKIVNGSPANAISTVPIMQWPH
jgi:CreA protein